MIKSEVNFFFLYKNTVFLTQAKYSYFSADFRLKILLRTFLENTVLGNQLQVFGVQICIVLHCAHAPLLFVLR